MLDFNVIQQRGFHNLKDKDGKTWGFQFGICTKYYKGIWLSQFRTRNAIVDGVVYPKSSLIWNIQGEDYTAEEMYDRTDVYWQVATPAYVKVPKSGGLSQGYHDIAIEFGWVNNYNTPLEKEPDGSGLGLMGPMMIWDGASSTGRLRAPPQRRLLLVW